MDSRRAKVLRERAEAYELYVKRANTIFIDKEDQYDPVDMEVGTDERQTPTFLHNVMLTKPNDNLYDYQKLTEIILDVIMKFPCVLYSCIWDEMFDGMNPLKIPASNYVANVAAILTAANNKALVTDDASKFKFIILMAARYIILNSNKGDSALQANADNIVRIYEGFAQLPRANRLHVNTYICALRDVLIAGEYQDDTYLSLRRVAIGAIIEHCNDNPYAVLVEQPRDDTPQRPLGWYPGTKQPVGIGINYSTWATNATKTRVGLELEGNTCFANAAIQAMVHCSPIRIVVELLSGVSYTGNGRQGIPNDKYFEDHQKRLIRVFLDLIASKKEKKSDALVLSTYFNANEQLPSEMTVKYPPVNAFRVWLLKYLKFEHEWHNSSQNPQMDASEFTMKCIQYLTSCPPMAAAPTSPQWFGPYSVLYMDDIPDDYHLSMCTLMKRSRDLYIIETQTRASDYVSLIKIPGDGGNDDEYALEFNLDGKTPRSVCEHRLSSTVNKSSSEPCGYIPLGFTTDGSENTVENMFKESQINYDVQVECEECNRWYQFTKKTECITFPRMLIFTISRFLEKKGKVDIEKSKRLKITNEHIWAKGASDRWIENEVSNMKAAGLNKEDIEKWKTAVQEYRLTSVICHEGENRNSGHYTAYCRAKQQWTIYNDKHVRPSDDQDKMNANAYVLFYRRGDMPA